MKVIKPSYEILSDITPFATYELELIEKAARTCYKSEDKYRPQGESAKKLIKKLIENGHEAMLEHSLLTVKFIVDRAIANEIVRHRLCAFAQESTRYVNYGHGHEAEFIAPCYLDYDSDAFAMWVQAVSDAEKRYLDLLTEECTPQEARGVLPLSLKTEIVVSANYREWRHILKLRCDKAAHPQIREVMLPLLAELTDLIPVVFDDIHQERVKEWKASEHSYDIHKRVKLATKLFNYFGPTHFEEVEDDGKK